MLLGDVLNSDASLNDFDVLGSMSFIPGEEIKLVIRLKQAQRKDLLRYVPPSTATVTCHLFNTDGTQSDFSMTLLTPDDRSIWTCTLQETDTENLAGGNLTFDVDVLGDGTKILKGYIQNALSLTITGGCC